MKKYNNVFMVRFSAAVTFLSYIMLSGAASAPASETTAPASEIEIIHNGSQASSYGGPEYFSGRVRIDSLFRGKGPSHVLGATVTFEPCARTAWHSHSSGQTLIVTQGTGLVQMWGGPVQQIHAGDIVWIPAGVKHWHGATPTTAMSHIAIVEDTDGKSTTWMEKVSDGLCQPPHTDAR